MLNEAHKEDTVCLEACKVLEVRLASLAPRNRERKFGSRLVDQVFCDGGPRLADDPQEHDAGKALLKAIFGFYRNPSAHTDSLRSRHDALDVVMAVDLMLREIARSA